MIAAFRVEAGMIESSPAAHKRGMKEIPVRKNKSTKRSGKRSAKRPAL